jgi:hypothetical protein
MRSDYSEDFESWKSKKTKSVFRKDKKSQKNKGKNNFRKEVQDYIDKQTYMDYDSAGDNYGY